MANFNQSWDNPRAYKIEMILMYRHGGGSRFAREYSGLPEALLDPETTENLARIKGDLEALSDDELDAKYKLAMEVEAARQEAARPFNYPSAFADFKHWAKCAYWSKEEAVALVFGRDPNRANPETIRPYLKVSSFAQQFDKILDLVTRAVGLEQLYNPTRPGPFLAWAKRYEIAVPTELEVEVTKYGHFISDWKTLYDQAKSQLDTAYGREKALAELLNKAKGDVEKLTREVADTSKMVAAMPPPDKELDPRELNSLRRLCVGMAIKGYRYNPADSRSAAIADIVGDLDRLGISVGRDTVRKHLQESAELLPQDWNK
jgi:hypothetical protein